MEKFRTGNIIKDEYGNIKIFIEYYTESDGRKLFKWLSFDSENSSGISPVLTETKKVDCKYCEGSGDDCEYCEGNGEYEYVRCGEDRHKLISSNAKDYLKSLLNNALNLI